MVKSGPRMVEAPAQAAAEPKAAGAVGPRRGARGRVRARILEVAIDLFAARGFDGVSTAEIAGAAGASQSVVLYHFGTKETLWREALRLLHGRIDAAPFLDADIYKDLDVVARLRVALRRLVYISARHPQYGRMILREAANGGERLDWLTRELIRPDLDVFRRLLAEGMASGRFKRLSPDLLAIAAQGAATHLFVAAPLHAAGLDRPVFDEDMVAEQADLIVEVFLDGLLTAPTRAGRRG